MYHSKRPIFLFVALLSFGGIVAATPPTSAQTAPPKHTQGNLSWVFDIKQDSSDIPRGKVYLRIGARKILILPHVDFGFNTLAPAEYKDHKIPARAVAACSGWWAGAGADLYVLRDGNRYVVYQRYLDEQSDIPPYKKIKTISAR